MKAKNKFKSLPIGIQTFSEIRTSNFYYVDKTNLISKLVEENKKYYFLSRPRRFGKSLFLSTLKSAFKAQKEYFKGLFLENNWNWDKKYPVLYISFGSGVTGGKEQLQIKLRNLIIDWKREYNIKKLKKEDLNGQFSEIIQILNENYKEKVVILIDEYDKPILDMIDKPNLAIEVRDELKNFYSVIKDSDEYLKFVFLTGVTKFSKVSLFSGLNNLEDITLDQNYATICGYTQNELETVFKERLVAVDLDKLKKWYNGYNFLGDKVYNPFGILLFFSKNNSYRTYWFQTATPTFLIKLLQENKYYIPDLEALEVSEDIIGSFDIDRIRVETLLFQTGYLTIDKTYKVFDKLKFKLKYPNFEVKTSLNTYIFDYLAEPTNQKHEDEFYKIMLNNDIKKIEKNIFALFEAITTPLVSIDTLESNLNLKLPVDNYRKNDISNYEGYYASVIYAYFAGMGIKMIAEDVTNKGYIDLTLFFEDKVYIIEFKVTTGTPKTNPALKQIKEKKYYKKYINEYTKIYNIGIVFSKNKRNIVKFNYETVK